MMVIGQTYGLLIKRYYVKVLLKQGTMYPKVVWIEVKDDKEQRKLINLLKGLKE